MAFEGAKYIRAQHKWAWWSGYYDENKPKPPEIYAGMFNTSGMAFKWR